MKIVDPAHAKAALISHEDQFSTAWLADVLGIHADDSLIQAMRHKRIGEGMIGKNLRIDIDYQHTQHAHPASLVVKFPSEELVSRATGAQGRLYEREVKFYRQIAPFVGDVVAKNHMAEISENGQEFCLLLEDMAPCEYGNQLTGCSVENAQAAMDAAAQLHAPFWDQAEIFQHEWLNHKNLMSRVVGLLQENIPKFLDIYEGKLSQENLDLIARFASLADKYYALHQAPLTITHGDYRLDNMMFQVQGGKRAICVVDWQTVLIRPGMTDVSFFLGCGLLPETRREHEAALVQRYHQQLLAKGVANYDWDACWRDYRLFAPQGLVQAILAIITTTRTERGDVLFQVMTERHCDQMRKLQTLDLVEQLSAEAHA